MASNSSLILMHVLSNTENNIDKVLRMLIKTQYSNDIGMGFRSIVLEDKKTIIGTVLKKTPIYINVLNQENQEIEKKIETILTEIDFSLDFNNNIIQAYTNLKDLKKLTSVFSNFFKDQLILLPLNVSLSTILLALNKMADVFEVKKMTVKDFQYEDGITGTFDMNFYKPEAAWSFIKDNSCEIEKVTFFFSLDDWEATAFLNSNGKLQLNTKYSKHTYKLLSIIKTILKSKNI